MSFEALTRWIASSFFALSILSITSCNNPNEEAAANVEAMRPEWQTLKDGSLFTRVGMGNGENQATVRCWKDDADGYECLKAASGVVGSLQITKLYELKLPTIIFPYGTADNGYSCNFVINVREEISKGGSTLISNEIANHPRWSPAFVRKYMTENDIPGYKHFKCLEILNAVQEGSLATVGTTSITQSMLE